MSLPTLLWISRLTTSRLRGFFFFSWCLFNREDSKKEKEGAEGSDLKQSPLSWTMYQDYSGNYDTSSRGSSTSPAQPESFTSGSSTIGSPISTSSYQVTQETPGFRDIIPINNTVIMSISSAQHRKHTRRSWYRCIFSPHRASSS